MRAANASFHDYPVTETSSSEISTGASSPLRAVRLHSRETLAASAGRLPDRHRHTVNYSWKPSLAKRAESCAPLSEQLVSLFRVDHRGSGDEYPLSQST
jgi:hypothetical protein